MTDQPGREPEQRLPARRPEPQPAPVERFSAPPSAHAVQLSPERAASIVRQSASARWVGFLATSVVVLFVLGYYFYELGLPAGLSQSRLIAEDEHQAVTSVERGYNIYRANCARCHGVQGLGPNDTPPGIGPALNDQAKLFVHLNAAYLHNVLQVGGRYVCGNPKSIMPVWSNSGSPPGPLTYKQVEDVINFIRAPSTEEYVVRDPDLFEPEIDEDTGRPKTFRGWRDPNFKPDPNATPVPDCWTNTGEATPSAQPSLAPDATVLEVKAQGIAFDVKQLSAPADEAFGIHFVNSDTGVPHDVDIRTADGTTVVDDPKLNDAGEITYSIPPLKAGEYTFICSVHPIPAMTGTLTVK